MPIADERLGDSCRIAGFHQLFGHGSNQPKVLQEIADLMINPGVELLLFVKKWVAC